MNLWFPPTHCQKTLEMQIPKAVAEKAVGLCGENPEPLPLLAPARALWACKPHPPQQGTLGSRKPGSLSAVGSHPVTCYLCLSDAESTNLQWLCSKGRSRKPGLQHCFPGMSSDGGEPWKQERRPFGDRERFLMRPLDSPLQSHISFCISRIHTQPLSCGRQTQTRAHYHPCAQNQSLERGFLPYSYNFFHSSCLHCQIYFNIIP